MKYVLISRCGDSEKIEAYLKWFRKYSNYELTEAYNKQARLGITGVHEQALYLAALHKEFLFRFGKSPVMISD